MASIHHLREQVADLRKELASALDEEEQTTIYLRWGKPRKLTREEARTQAAETAKIRRHIATYGMGSVKLKWAEEEN